MMRCAIALVFVLSGAPVWAEFYCKGSSEPACLKPNTVLCKPGSICLPGRGGECGSQGYTCQRYLNECSDTVQACSDEFERMRQHYDDRGEELQDEFEALYEARGEAVEALHRAEYELQAATDAARGMEVVWREMVICVRSAQSLAQAQDCTR